jgi:hypothetical protein
MPDRNECNPGDFANKAAVDAKHAADNALLVSTTAAVEAAAVDGLVNIQMAKGPVVPQDGPAYLWTDPTQAFPFSVNGRYVTPGPVVQTNKQAAVIAIIRGDATLV